MSTENKLKDLILTRYRSIREFTQFIDMPYSTFDAILKRGIDNSSVSNIIKICKALGISADALANGEIVHIIAANHLDEEIDIEHLISDVKRKILNYDNLRLKGKIIDELGRMILVDCLDMSLEFATKQISGDRLEEYTKRLMKSYNKNHNKT